MCKRTPNPGSSWPPWFFPVAATKRQNWNWWWWSSMPHAVMHFVDVTATAYRKIHTNSRLIFRVARVRWDELSSLDDADNKKENTWPEMHNSLKCMHAVSVNDLPVLPLWLCCECHVVMVYTTSANFSVAAFEWIVTQKLNSFTLVLATCWKLFGTKTGKHKGCSRNYPGGAHFFSDPSTPRTYMGSEPPNPQDT